MVSSENDGPSVEALAGRSLCSLHCLDTGLGNDPSMKTRGPEGMKSGDFSLENGDKME